MMVVTPKRDSGEARVASVSAAYLRKIKKFGWKKMVVVTRIELVTPTMST